MDARCPRCGATIDFEGAVCSACDPRGGDGWAERYARAKAREEEAVRALGDRSKGVFADEVSEHRHRDAVSRVTRRVWVALVLALLVAVGLFVFREQLAQMMSPDASPVAE